MNVALTFYKKKSEFSNRYYINPDGILNICETTWPIQSIFGPSKVEKKRYEICSDLTKLEEIEGKKCAIKYVSTAKVKSNLTDFPTPIHNFFR